MEEKEVFKFRFKRGDLEVEFEGAPLLVAERIKELRERKFYPPGIR